MATHLAAVCTAKGRPFELQSRSTPKPGPDEILIAVKAVALNPADVLMCDQGLYIPKYPTVIGFDLAGVVLEVGHNVPADAFHDGPGPCFRPGITRVVAYAASFWRSIGPDYGAYQERCLVPWQHAVPLPDEGMSWNLAVTLPVAVETSLIAWEVMGVPRVGEATASSLASAGSAGTIADEGGPKNNMGRKQALLVWGASSSVGTMGVQTARLLRDDPSSSFAAVYATAGSTNEAYVTSLGADRVFDYKSPQVVDAIVSAAKGDGLVIRHCFLATGQLAPCQAVLKAFLGDDHQEGKNTKTVAKIGSAPLVPPDAEVVDGVETIFVLPSTVEEERLQLQHWIGMWLRKNLSKGTITPSPEPKVVGKGLGAINAGVDMLRRGVSCMKSKRLLAPGTLAIDTGH
ncbi:hypothetical protein SLS62_006152 [Diatrype stigma]|uniref:Enoyl reductase (ER) domain-containing protein n=1 Tax=Diatrype stigma TaxID=117547 RepID=A0AAN9YP90_9PEZI